MGPTVKGLVVAGEILGGLVVAKCNKFGVTGEGAGGRFGEFDFGDGFGAEVYIVGISSAGDALGPGGRPA